eukprot:11179792-Lingulodinium_polyedra.AAC.1
MQHRSGTQVEPKQHSSNSTRVPEVFPTRAARRAPDVFHTHAPRTCPHMLPRAPKRGPKRALNARDSIRARNVRACSKR